MLDLTYPLLLSPETRKLVQQQLVFLLHANVCSTRDKQNASCAEASQPPCHPECNLENCKQFKQLMEHMHQCRVGPLCGRNYCPTSKIIMKHWNDCQNLGCVVCAPIRLRQT